MSPIDVFSKYIFVAPITSTHAGAIEKVLVPLFFQQSYIPTTILSDLGTSVDARLLHELTDLLEIMLQHASLKHPQTSGVIERSRSALKRFLILHTDEN